MIPTDTALLRHPAARHVPPGATERAARSITRRRTLCSTILRKLAAFAGRPFRKTGGLPLAEDILPGERKGWKTPSLRRQPHQIPVNWRA